MFLLYANDSLCLPSLFLAGFIVSQLCWLGCSENKAGPSHSVPRSWPVTLLFSCPEELFIAEKFFLGVENASLGGWDNVGKMKSSSFFSCAIILAFWFHCVVKTA